MLIVIILQPISPCNFGTTPALSDRETGPLRINGINLINSIGRNITASLAINVDNVTVLYLATSQHIKVVS